MAAITDREFLAGGTDLLERRRSGVAAVAPVRLTITDAMRGINWRDDGGATIGAGVTIDALAQEPRIATAYSGLAAAARGLATPEIRRMATVGGNLTQRSRCWYYRNHAIPCLKKGGTTCPAREGNHLYGVVFDLGACVAPHPSTLGAALLAYDARVNTSLRPEVSIADVFGDGRDGTRDHQLKSGEILQAILLPQPVSGERAVYNRAISRAHAEWPLVEIVARVGVREGVITQAAIALGGVAPVPMRLAALEASLVGAALASLPVEELARRATQGAKPLPMTEYKVALIEGLVRDALGQIGTSSG